MFVYGKANTQDNVQRNGLIISNPLVLNKSIDYDDNFKNINLRSKPSQNSVLNFCSVHSVHLRLPHFLSVQQTLTLVRKFMDLYPSILKLGIPKRSTIKFTANFHVGPTSPVDINSL
jgi:hypothetical protein